jgi:predicted nicotinamide N-methyase
MTLHRSRVPELMDAEDLDPAAHDAALRGLARLNRASRSDAILWSGLRRLARATDRTLRVLDVATGSGDLPAALDARARREGIRLEWVLCDRSPQALANAQLAARKHAMRCSLTRVDVLREPLPTGCDVVISSLFLHHMDRAEVVKLLGAMREAAGMAIGVADLDRTRLGLCMAWMGAHALTRSPIVHFDAVASVRAAHARGEIEQMARDAGLHGCTVDRAWPQRWRLWWHRAPGTCRSSAAA